MTSRPELHCYTPENAKGIPTRIHYDQVNSFVDFDIYI